MARRRWRRWCRARRGDGAPCRAYAITGGTVCVAHGGAAPRVRQAAAVRLAEESIQRSLDRARERLARERAAWFAARVRWAAKVLDADPADVETELARPYGSVFLLVPVDAEWPPGLRDEDEPRLRPDGRYGRRLRAVEAPK